MASSSTKSEKVISLIKTGQCGSLGVINDAQLINSNSIEGGSSSTNENLLIRGAKNNIRVDKLCKSDVWEVVEKSVGRSRKNL